MATIIPFKGIRYNAEKISDLSEVTAPPYDVISPEQQEGFHRAHPNNIIRLILGKDKDTDTRDDNRHTRAADYFNKWREEGVLKRDEEPALYLTSIEFPIGDETFLRYGILALVGLEPFDKGVVLPHERTFSKVKSERLELMKICRANFCSIFSLYSDEESILDSLIEATRGLSPDMDFTDSAGHRQRLWRITDPAVHESVSKAMAGKTIFIADGHHRYETALNYRAWLAENDPDFDENHPANYVMMSLSSIEDPGMVIRPAHRLLQEVSPETLEKARRVTGDYFHVKAIPFEPENRQAAQKELIDGMAEDPGSNKIGVLMKDHHRFFVLTIKEGVMEKMFGGEMPPELRDLDVSVLTRLLFMEILGFDQARLDNEKLISYTTVVEEAVDTVLAGKTDVAFLLNPTKIDQVQAVARKGEIMPRKSTYFYPKVISGQVMNTLIP